MLLRLNLPQALPATMARVSRSTASRVVSARTPVIAQALQANVPVVEDLDPTARLVVDMAGIKQNGILGQLLRDSWLASAEHLV